MAAFSWQNVMHSLFGPYDYQPVSPNTGSRKRKAEAEVLDEVLVKVLNEQTETRYRYAQPRKRSKVSDFSTEKTSDYEFYALGMKNASSDDTQKIWAAYLASVQSKNVIKPTVDQGTQKDDTTNQDLQCQLEESQKQLEAALSAQSHLQDSLKEAQANTIAAEQDAKARRDTDEKVNQLLTEKLVEADRAALKAQSRFEESLKEAEASIPKAARQEAEAYKEETMKQLNDKLAATKDHALLDRSQFSQTFQDQQRKTANAEEKLKTLRTEFNSLQTYWNQMYQTAVGWYGTKPSPLREAVCYLLKGAIRPFAKFEEVEKDSQDRPDVDVEDAVEVPCPTPEVPQNAREKNDTSDNRALTDENKRLQAELEKLKQQCAILASNAQSPSVYPSPPSVKEESSANTTPSAPENVQSPLPIGEKFVLRHIGKPSDKPKARSYRLHENNRSAQFLHARMPQIAALEQDNANILAPNAEIDSTNPVVVQQSNITKYPSLRGLGSGQARKSGRGAVSSVQKVKMASVRSDMKRRAITKGVPSRGIQKSQKALPLPKAMNPEDYECRMRVPSILKKNEAEFGPFSLEVQCRRAVKEAMKERHTDVQGRAEEILMGVIREEVRTVKAALREKKDEEEAEKQQRDLEYLRLDHLDRFKKETSLFKKGDFTSLETGWPSWDLENSEMRDYVDRSPHPPLEFALSEDDFNPSSFNILPLKHKLVDDNEKMEYGGKCILALMPELQLEAASKFLSRDEVAKFQEQSFPDGLVFGKTYKERTYPKPWQFRVEWFRQNKVFRNAARLWAAGEPTNGKFSTCWPPSFCDTGVLFECIAIKDDLGRHVHDSYHNGGLSEMLKDELQQAGAEDALDIFNTSQRITDGAFARSVGRVGIGEREAKEMPSDRFKKIAESIRSREASPEG